MRYESRRVHQDTVTPLTFGSGVLCLRKSSILYLEETTAMKEFLKRIWNWVKKNPAIAFISLMWTITSLFSLIGGFELMSEHKCNGIAVIVVTMMGYMAAMAIILEDQEK